MLLGQLLGEVRRHENPAALLAEEPDLVLLARAQAAAERAGQGLGDFVAEAVAAFFDHADEGEWARLVGRLQDGGLGAAGCLNLMLRSRLGRESPDGAPPS